MRLRRGQSTDFNRAYICAPLQMSSILKVKVPLLDFFPPLPSLLVLFFLSNQRREINAWSGVVSKRIVSSALSSAQNHLHHPFHHADDPIQSISSL